MAVEAYALNKGDFDMQRLDFIYDSEPLGFEKDPKAPERIRPKDPLEEVDLGENGEKRPTYISANIDNKLKSEVNVQVEAANKVIISLIKKHIGKKTRNWHKTLDQALWACRTSPKEATGTTPFRLTYGHDAVLPVKIQVQAVRTQRQYEIPSEDYWSMMTDELVDVDEERMLSLDSLQRQKEKVSRAYNKRVKGKVFTIADLVWRVILPMDRNDKMLGKWSPNWEGPFKVLQVFSNNAYEVEELAPDRRILRVNGKYLKKYRPLLQEVKILAD
ncbi:uncharacterized protein LOC127086841 [Lathyrus oleraceus]|uniref:uncharacterized protein LOC127086841 n=1 Tax=Pisum sativum TaxID=3888 RepID=UPI0021D2C9F6|nr:uncharacterized protein LOC127086841 [Pisum sativum]